MQKLKNIFASPTHKFLYCSCIMISRIPDRLTDLSTDAHFPTVLLTIFIPEMLPICLYYFMTLRQHSPWTTSPKV